MIQLLGQILFLEYKKPLYYLDFNNINESKLDETNPKKMIFEFNAVMANLCNKNKTDRILLAGLGGGTILPALKSKNKTILNYFFYSILLLDFCGHILF